MELKELTSYLDEFLAIKEVDDGFFNGLTIEGKAEVQKIGFAVDCGIETFEKAIQQRVDILITHHGHFSKMYSPVLVGWKKERVIRLLNNDISLYTAHIPLDRHKEVGNNAQLLKMLGATITQEFSPGKGKHIGWIGEIKGGLDRAEIERQLTHQLGASVHSLPFGPDKINTIAVCSGGGGYGRYIEAEEAGVDLYITGDQIDVYQAAKDAQLNVMFAGHNATETIGLKALMAHLEDKFGLHVVFLDAPTGL